LLTVNITEPNIDSGAKCGEHNQGGFDDMPHETERSQILRALEMAGGVVSGPHGAAARLRVKRSTLVSRMQKLGIAVSGNYFCCSQKQESLWRASL